MENASKALIIAGAILLAIAIIGIGMYIYSQAADQVGGAGADLTKQQIDTFNSTYLAYQGTKTGQQLRTLLGNIRTFNAQTELDADKIGVHTGDASADTASSAGSLAITDINSQINAISVGARYDITFGFDPNTGRVISVGYTQHQ